MDNKSNDKLTIKEQITVIIVTLVAFLLPASIVGFIFMKFTSLNFIVGGIISIIVELILIFTFGLHKPAYSNEYNKDDEDEEEDY